MVSDEQAKFLVADQDHDSALNVAEYSAFLHPHNYDYMHAYEIDRTISDYDRNNDGVVSFNEYVGECKHFMWCYVSLYLFTFHARCS